MVTPRFSEHFRPVPQREAPFKLSDVAEVRRNLIARQQRRTRWHKGLRIAGLTGIVLSLAGIGAVVADGLGII